MKEVEEKGKGGEEKGERGKGNGKGGWRRQLE